FIRVTGTIEAEKDAFISPEISGQINVIHVEEGQLVNKGQLLISLTTSVIESNIDEVETNLELAREMYKKQKNLWEQQIGSEVQYLQSKNSVKSLEAKLQTLKAQLEMSKIQAPFSGIVNTIFQKEGELASPGMQLLQMVNIENLKVITDVSEKYISDVEEGDEVKVSFPSYPDVSLNLPVVRVSKVIDPNSRTFEIEMKLRNDRGEFRPNLIANVLINVFSSESAYVVPSKILKKDMRGYFLYKAETRDSLNVAVKQYVKPGLSHDEVTMILEGLQKDNKIIVDGYNLVSDGVNVEIRDIVNTKNN
ncbi:MAG: efflux RND transporter periplasmic adaptor subunit, partial [bacterium]